jgi:hypothetical protein
VSIAETPELKALRQNSARLFLDTTRMQQAVLAAAVWVVVYLRA